MLLIYLPFYRGSRIFSTVSHGFNIRDAPIESRDESDRVRVLLFIRERLYERMLIMYPKRGNSSPENTDFISTRAILIFFWNSSGSAKLHSAVWFLSLRVSRRGDSIRLSFAYLAGGHAELRTLAGERERDTTRWQSCQRRPINLSSGCWHGDCRTELGWMARRAMRGHSRILHETVTEKLEAATAPVAQGVRGERRGTVFEGKLYVGTRK